MRTYFFLAAFLTAGLAEDLVATFGAVALTAVTFLTVFVGFAFTDFVVALGSTDFLAATAALFLTALAGFAVAGFRVLFRAFAAEDPIPAV